MLHLCGYASDTFCSGSLQSVTWNRVAFSGFCDHWAVQSYIQYFSLNHESNSDNFSLLLPAQCLSPRWWFLWSCHICYTGHCSGTSYDIVALLSTSLDSKWLCLSAFVPVAGVWELWFDTDRFVGCFGKCSNSVKGDLMRWSLNWCVWDPFGKGSEGSNSLQYCLLSNICVLPDCCPLSCTQLWLLSAEMESEPILIGALKPQKKNP